MNISCHIRAHLLKIFFRPFPYIYVSTLYTLLCNRFVSRQNEGKKSKAKKTCSVGVCVSMLYGIKHFHQNNQSSKLDEVPQWRYLGMLWAAALTHIKSKSNQNENSLLPEDYFYGNAFRSQICVCERERAKVCACVGDCASEWAWTFIMIGYDSTVCVLRRRFDAMMFNIIWKFYRFTASAFSISSLFFFLIFAHQWVY